MLHIVRKTWLKILIIIQEMRKIPLNVDFNKVEILYKKIELHGKFLLYGLFLSI